MGRVDKRLAPGERVYHHLHRHWRALAGSVVVLLLTCGVAGFLAAMSPVAALRWVVVVLAAAVVVWWVVRPFLRWLTTTYTITDRRILLREGVLSRSGRDIPLGRVTDVAFRNTLLQRMFGCGTLLVESASELGQVVLADVPSVEVVQRDLCALVDAEAAGDVQRP